MRDKLDAVRTLLQQGWTLEEALTVVGETEKLERISGLKKDIWPWDTMVPTDSRLPLKEEELLLVWGEGEE